MTWKLILYGSIKLSRTELHVSQYMLFVCLLTVSGDFYLGLRCASLQILLRTAVARPGAREAMREPRHAAPQL